MADYRSALFAAIRQFSPHINEYHLKPYQAARKGIGTLFETINKNLERVRRSVPIESKNLLNTIDEDLDKIDHLLNVVEDTHGWISELLRRDDNAATIVPLMEDRIIFSLGKPFSQDMARGAISAFKSELEPFMSKSEAKFYTLVEEYNVLKRRLDRRTAWPPPAIARAHLRRQRLRPRYGMN